jgi:hypothetical protein
MATFLPQIDDDQVGNVLDHLPPYAHVDLNLGGRHLTAQITHDQRAPGASPYAQLDLDVGGRKLQATIQRVSGDEGVCRVLHGGAAVAGDPGWDRVTQGAEVAGDPIDDAEIFQAVGYAYHDDNVRPPAATRWQIVGDHSFELSAQSYQIVGRDEVGGFFNSIAKAIGINKKLEKKIKAKTGKTVKINFKNPSIKSIAKDVVHAASVGVKVASLVVPGLGLASVAGKAVSGIGKATGVISAASKAKAAIHAAGAAVAADKLVAAAERGGAAAKTARAVVRQTTHLAARGNVDAKAAVSVLNRVVAHRRVAAIPKGREQPLTAKGSAALLAFASAPKLDSRLIAPPTAAGRRGWFISTEKGSYGRVDFSQGLNGKWRPA